MRKYGFTLVEVLFVVIIAAGVLAFAMPAYKRMQERSDYNAALGNLLDVGNAVNALKRDLKVVKGASVSFPTSAAFWNATQNGSFTQDVTGTTWNKWLVGHADSSANWNTQFWGALFTFNYLKPLQNKKGYSFYVLTPGGNTNSICSGRCKTSKGDGSNSSVMACMCKSGTKNGCYFGAVMLTDGNVERITADSTSCKN